jgi:hypothetical protein
MPPARMTVRTGIAIAAFVAILAFSFVLVVDWPILSYPSA